MADYVTRKFYEPNLDLDLASNEILRDPTNLKSGKNVRRLIGGGFGCRPGNEIIAGDDTAAEADQVAGAGLFVHKHGGIAFPSAASAQEAEEHLLFVGDNRLWRLPRKTDLIDTRGNVEVVYSGTPSYTLVEITVAFDSSTGNKHFKILGDSSSLLDYDMGQGKSEASIKTVTDLATAITAVSGFTASVTAGSSTHPAAFIPTARYTGDSSGFTLNIKFFPHERIYTNKDDDSLFDNIWTARNDLIGEDGLDLVAQNILTTSLNGNTYIGSSRFLTSDAAFLIKYDGNRVYRAGVVRPASATAASGAAGVLTAGTYKYLVTRVFIDANGNKIESDDVTSGTVTVGGSSSIDVTIPSDQGGTAFSNAGAVADGLQVVGVGGTMNVDDGAGGDHSVQVGDIIHFRNSSGTMLQEKVTARTSSTVTIVSGAFTVSDNEPISVGMRYSIYRTTATGSATNDYFFVDEIVNDSYSTNSVYNDQILDANLGAQYLFPDFAHDVSEAAGATQGLAAYRGLLVVSKYAFGATQASNEVIFSYDPTQIPSAVSGSSEYLSRTFSFLIDDPDPITAIVSSEDYFIVFTRNSCHLVRGDLLSGAFTVDRISTSVGALHQGVTKVVQNEIWFVDKTGLYRIVGGATPEKLFPLVESDFLIPGINPDVEYKNATLFRPMNFQMEHDPIRRWVLLYMPTPGPALAGTGQAVNEADSQTLVFDYGKGVVYKWRGLNMLGGITVYKDDLWFSDYADNAFRSYRTGFVRKLLNNTDPRTAVYFDHGAAIDWDAWFGDDNFGEQGVFQKAQRVKIYSYESSTTPAFDCRVRTYVDHDQTTVDSDKTINFSSTVREGDVKLKKQKNRSISVRLSGTAQGEAVEISGFEVEGSVPYRTAIKE